MNRRISGIDDVVERQLCSGCGACAFAQPDEIEMVDDYDLGRRPVQRQRDADTSRALSVCPGLELARRQSEWDGGYIEELAPDWGPVLKIWEGYAADPEIRFAGSSGGVATALVLSALRADEIEGVLHIGARPDLPYLNQTIFSTTRDELLAATGSRYAPASPCDSLDWIAEAGEPCAFIGKPCDVAGARKAAALDPDLQRNLGLTIAMFCAGTPSTRGTLEMVKRMGVADPSEITGVRYRGNGWPGAAEVTVSEDSSATATSLSYDESWGEILQQHRTWRCYICPDHTGEFADVAVGDPWYQPTGSDPGRSLVLARTERGRQFVEQALATGDLILERSQPAALIGSQPNLLSARGSAWGRIIAAKLTLMPGPTFRAIQLRRTWWSRLDWRMKLRSVLSTIRRRARGALPGRVRVAADASDAHRHHDSGRRRPR